MVFKEIILNFFTALILFSFTTISLAQTTPEVISPVINLILNEEGEELSCEIGITPISPAIGSTILVGQQGLVQITYSFNNLPSDVRAKISFGFEDNSPDDIAIIFFETEDGGERDVFINDFDENGPVNPSGQFNMVYDNVGITDFIETPTNFLEGFAIVDLEVIATQEDADRFPNIEVGDIIQLSLRSSIPFDPSDPFDPFDDPLNEGSDDGDGPCPFGTRGTLDWTVDPGPSDPGPSDPGPSET